MSDRSFDEVKNCVGGSTMLHWRKLLSGMKSSDVVFLFSSNIPSLGVQSDNTVSLKCVIVIMIMKGNRSEGDEEEKKNENSSKINVNQRQDWRTSGIGVDPWIRFCRYRLCWRSVFPGEKKTDELCLSRNRKNMIWNSCARREIQRNSGVDGFILHECDESDGRSLWDCQVKFISSAVAEMFLTRRKFIQQRFVSFDRLSITDI